MNRIVDFLLSERLSQMGVLPFLITGIFSLLATIIANKINGVQERPNIHATVNNSFNNNVINNTSIYFDSTFNNDELPIFAFLSVLLFVVYVKYGLFLINLLYILSIFLLFFSILYIVINFIKGNRNIFSLIPFLVCLFCSSLLIKFIDYAGLNFNYYINNYSQLNFSIDNLKIYFWIFIQASSITLGFIVLYLLSKYIYAAIHRKIFEKELNMLVVLFILVFVYYLGVSGKLYMML